MVRFQEDISYVLQNQAEFFKAYRILIENGAKSRDVMVYLFYLKDTVVIETPEFIELLLYENDPEINSKLLRSFYVSDCPEIYYPLFQKYGLQPTFEEAITNIKSIDHDKTIKFLLEIGVIKHQDFTEEKIKQIFIDKGMEDSWMIDAAIGMFYIMKQENSIPHKQQSVVSNQTQKEKITKKQSIKASTEIDKIFEQAQKNIDESTKE